MKRIIKKTSIFMLIALFAVCTLMGMTSGNIFAEAKDTTVRANVELSDNLNGKGLVKGKSFTLTLTITATNPNLWFDGFNLYIAPIKSATAATQELDYDVAQKLSGVNNADGLLDVKSSLKLDGDAYKNTMSTDYFQSTTSAERKGTCLFGISFVGGNVTDYRVYGNQAITVSTEITVDKSIEVDQLILSIYRGVNSQGKALANSISVNNAGTNELYTPTGSAVKDKGAFTNNILVIDLKNEDEDNSLESLEIGPAADALTAVDMTVEKPTYTVDAPMDTMVVKPVAGAPEKATVQVGVTDAEGTLVGAPVGLTEDGTVTLSPRPTHGQKIKVTVTSKVGVAVDYFVEIVVSYARLVALTSDITPEEGTTLGFQETIGSDGLATTFAYTLHVPTVQAVQLTPTVLSGYEISETIAVAVTGGTADATVDNAAAATITMTDATTVVTLTLTAADETTTQDYTITILSADVSITTFTLTGDSGTVYNSDAGMASGGIDYYFSVDKEATVQGKMTIVAATGATVQVEGLAYDATTVYAKGEYSVTVTAVAGNSKVYKVKINAPEFLELKDESYYQFLYEYEEDGFYFRMAYEELPDYDMDALEHGVNDAEVVSTFVLGQIKPRTTLGEFFKHIKSPLTYIQLCVMFDDGEEYVLFDRGEYDDPDYETQEFICTGYYIKFGSGDVPSETVYLSVLGDVNGDGSADAIDGTFMQNIMREVVLLSDLPIEVRLAGYLNDAGEWNATTFTVMSAIGRETIFPEDLYWYRDGYEFPETLSNAPAFAAAPMMLFEEAEEVVVTEVKTAPRLAVNTQEMSEDATEEPTENEEPINNQPVVPSKKFGYTDWDVKEKTL